MGAAHATSESPFAVVACRHCGAGVERDSMEVGCCPQSQHALYQLAWCLDFTYVRACLQTHVGQCRQCPVVSPHGCGATMARNELAEHAECICPHEPVACAVAGCGTVVTSAEMAAHVGGDERAIEVHVSALETVCFAS